jgi:hypothetical protein
MIILQWIISLILLIGILFIGAIIAKEFLMVAFWFVHTGCQILYGACEDCFRPATKLIGGYDPYKICKKHIRNYR